MKPMYSQPLISGKCVDGETEYRVFAADGDGYYSLFGQVKINSEWRVKSWTERGIEGLVTAWNIPAADVTALLSGVIETKENG